MRKDLLIIALGLFAPVGIAVGDVLTVPPAPDAQPAVTLPAKGTSMADVEKKFGSPRVKRPTVGGGSPKQPPITRWDYEGFLVIFEHDKVVDAVIPGAPPRIYSKEGLQAAVDAPPMPGAAPPAPLAPAEAPAEAPLQPSEAAPAQAAPGDAAPAEGPVEMSPLTPAEEAATAPAADSAAEPAPETTPEATPENPYPDRPPAE